VLIAAVVCFAAWPNLYKAAEARWRYELFTLDFGIGALAFGLFAAYTLGTFGPGMSFSDRLLIAGNSAALWVVATGGIFAFGFLLLLAATSLLGLSAAFPISSGFAAILIVATHFRFLQPAWAIGGMALLAVAIAWAAVSSRRFRSTSRTVWRKGFWLALAAGIPFSLVQWMLRHTADPEFGPGPYASTLLFALGFLLATPAYNFYLMHIKIVGNPISFRFYKLGGLHIHVPGFVAGAIWSLGLLLLLAALNATEEAALSSSLAFSLPFLAITLCVFCGLLVWREYRNPASSRARILLILCAICIALGSTAVGLSYSK
jgi:glucose uptake protein